MVKFTVRPPVANWTPVITVTRIKRQVRTPVRFKGYGSQGEPVATCCKGVCARSRR